MKGWSIVVLTEGQIGEDHHLCVSVTLAFMLEASMVLIARHECTDIFCNDLELVQSRSQIENHTQRRLGGLREWSSFEESAIKLVHDDVFRLESIPDYSSDQATSDSICHSCRLHEDQLIKFHHGFAYEDPM